MGFTKVIAVNGWSTLKSVMKAAGYNGGGLVSSLSIFNPNDETVYIHLTNDGSNHPATGTDGWPVGNDAAAVGNQFNSDRGANLASLDIGTTWLYSANPVNIKVLATGT